jgi:hypothetical protein
MEGPKEMKNALHSEDEASKLSSKLLTRIEEFAERI